MFLEIGDKMIKNNFYKMFFTFLMTCFSMHVFIMNIKISNVNIEKVTHHIYRFDLLLGVSMNEFDILWIILFIFIYYFFYHNYFIDNRFNKTKLISSILASIISISIIIGESYYNYKDLSMIFSSFVQIFKCTMIGIGYYLIIYILIRNTLIAIRGIKHEQQNN